MIHASGDQKTGTFTPTHNGVGIRDGSEPKEPMHVRLTQKWLCTSVSPVDSYVNVLQDDLSFF
jgi:hypothetical protein